MGFLAYWAAPSGVAVLLLALGMVATALRRPRWALPLLGSGGATWLVFSCGPVAAALLSPLEYAFPVFRGAPPPDARLIVVLTAYAAPDPELSEVSRLNGNSAQRVLETLVLARRCPGCRVLVSGTATGATGMGRALVAAGLPRSRLSIDGASPDTADSARVVASLDGGGRVLLVTSAGHMPRALATLQRRGVRAIPVPTDHQLPRRPLKASWAPSPTHLQAADLAVHEYVAIGWYRLRGRI